jgi:glycine betaine/proline transport system permease protein
MLEFFDEFPDISRGNLRDLKNVIDSAFRSFSRAYGESIENFFDPLLWFLIWVENFLLTTPWPIVMLIIAAICYLGARSWKLPLASIVTFLIIGYLGMWEDTMSTIALISVATILCIVIGMPLGIWMARSDRVEKILNPLLDIMQTIPIFVYLLPVLMLLGIGKVPGLIAVCVYAMPPMVRFTNLGIRLVDEDIIEASNAFGASTKQRLFEVQIPLALPNIFAGINQTIMMALAMVVIASMIGVRGLGIPVLQAIQNQYFALGLMNGLAIVALAILFDRVLQRYGKRLQKHNKGRKNV